MGIQLNNNPNTEREVFLRNTKKNDNENKRHGGIFYHTVPIIATSNSDEAYVQVMNLGDVGTKSNVAYLVMREGIKGDFIGKLVEDAIFTSVDKLVSAGVTNDIYLSLRAIYNSCLFNCKVSDAIEEKHYKVSEKIAKLGVNLCNLGGEVIGSQNYIKIIGIDCIANAFIQKRKMIDSNNICPKEFIVGLASDGKAIYEYEENSGIGNSSLLSIGINQLLNMHYLVYPETIDTIGRDTYHGKYHLMDNLEGTSLTIWEAILSPTRTYLPVIREILQDDSIYISGIIKCSEQGLTRSLDFGKGIKYVIDEYKKLKVPAIFEEIKRNGKIEDRCMYEIFNMGIGMMVITSTLADAEKVIQYANKYGINAYVIGHTETSKDGANILEIGSLIYTK